MADYRCRMAVSLSVLLLLPPCIMVAQSAPPPAAPGVQSQPVQASGGAQPGYTLRTSTNLVVLDVVATDAAGKPVHGLAATDFTVKEDDGLQLIRHFEEHSTATAEAAPKPASIPKLAPGLFTNNSVVTSNGPANVLLLDMLNTPLQDQSYAREQILAYFSHAPAHTRIAIFGLANSLSILQGFTSDPEILKAVLSGKNAARLSSLLNDPTGGGAGDGGGATALSDSLTQLGDVDPTNTTNVEEMVANAQQFESEVQAEQLKVRAQVTLDALNELGHYLANIPGRKNVIWFSGSFPVSVLPDASLTNGFMASTSSQEEFRDTMTLLAKSQVSLYPVDVRGLRTTGTFNAAVSGQKYASNPQAMGKDIAKFNTQTASENGTMLDAAQETGGRAFINTNGLTEAVAKAIEDGSNYYTLTYSPTNKATDGKYRKLDVAARRKDVVLSYRRGYYADDSPNSATSHGSTAKPASANAADTSIISRSMVRGAPPSTQIEFTVRVRTLTGTPETTAAAGNEVMTTNPEAHPPYIRYAVDFAIDSRGFSFNRTPDAYQDAIQFVAFVYDANGALVTRAGSTMHANLTEAVHANFLRQPLSYNLDISAPAKGSYFLRLAIQDMNSQRIGAIEIPLDAARKLPPLTPATAAPTK